MRPQPHVKSASYVEQTEEPAGARRRSLASYLKVPGLVWAVIVIGGCASLLSPYFVQPANLINVLRQVALSGVVSVGMTFVILTAGIDLSVGSIMAIVTVACALLLNSGFPFLLVVSAGVLLGALMGLFNGAGVVFGRVPAFIMTLGTMVMGRGIAMMLSNGQPVNLDVTDGPFAEIGNGFLLSIPVPVWIFALVAFLGTLVLRFLPFGRSLYAVGSNTEAARLAGVNVSATRLIVYIVSGALAGLTALIFLSRLTVAEPTAGTGIELEAIAVTVIGGTSLFGGEGGIGGTILGAMILAILANMLNLVGIGPFAQQVIKGAIIIAAVLFEIRRNPRA
ncbi:MAG: ribose ABC transporter permease [Acidobacteria bacterium]|nr:MAG: ribose ABC transporter permease [Acidobacteriota bacterium]